MEPPAAEGPPDSHRTNLLRRPHRHVDLRRERDHDRHWRIDYRSTLRSHGVTNGAVQPLLRFSPVPQPHDGQSGVLLTQDGHPLSALSVRGERPAHDVRRIREDRPRRCSMFPFHST